MSMWGGFASSDEEFGALAQRSENELRSADFDDEGPRYWTIAAPPRDAPPPSAPLPAPMPRTFDGIAKRCLADPEFAAAVRSDPQLCAAFIAEGRRRREAAAAALPIVGATFNPKVWAKDAVKNAVSKEKGIAAWVRAHKRGLWIGGAIAAGLLVLGGDSKRRRRR